MNGNIVAIYGKTKKAKPPSMEVWNWKIIELNGIFPSKPCLVIYKKLSALADLFFAEKIAGTFPIPFFPVQVSES